MSEVSEGRPAGEKTSILELLPHELDKMKKVTLMVPDERMALLEGLAKAITDMEIIEVKNVEYIEEYQRKSAMERFDFALKAVVAEKGVIVNLYDYAWIYTAVQEGSVKGITMFSSVNSFRKHLKKIGIKNVPSNSTISDKVVYQDKPFPIWKYDCDITEVKRRINVVKRFLCLYNKGK